MIIFKSNKTFLLLCLLLSNAICLFAQDRKILARVLDDSTGKPIKNVLVTEVGTRKHTFTNHLGYFEFVIDDRSGPSLLLTKVGYIESVIKVPANKHFTINLQPLVGEGYEAVSGDRASGTLFQGHRLGIWDYYDEPGQLALQYSHSNEKVTYMPVDTTAYYVKINGEWQSTQVDYAPRFLGSINALNSFIVKNIRYPGLASFKGTEGALYLTFEIDTLGKATNIEVVGDIGQNCGKAANEAFKTVPNYWLPAAKAGKKYRSKMCFIVNFRLRRNHPDIRKIKHQPPTAPAPKARLMDRQIVVIG